MENTENTEKKNEEDERKEEPVRGGKSFLEWWHDNGGYDRVVEMLNNMTFD